MRRQFGDQGLSIHQNLLLDALRLVVIAGVAVFLVSGKQNFSLVGRRSLSCFSRGSCDVVINSPVMHFLLVAHRSLPSPVRPEGCYTVVTC